jgi:2-dehydro-3-deoxyphosphogalactonate aldolase
MSSFLKLTGDLPLVAILRGVTPDAVEAIGDVLVAAGFRAIEVPLNSPDPLESIGRLQKRLGDRALIGAGTVTDVAQVMDLHRLGARLVVSPHTDIEVIRATKAAGMLSLPGFFTASEAFAALKAGADALKLFPAEAAAPVVLKALRAVIAGSVPVLPVGGISPEKMKDYRAAGASGFGLGGALYQPGMTAEQVAPRAAAFAAAWKEG